MESPPQFAPPAPPQKKSNALLIIILVILGFCALCCVGIILFSMNMWGKMSKGVGCVIHYEFARKALSDYAVAHDGNLPAAASWQDDVATYYGKSKSGEKVSGAGILDFGDASKDLGCASDGTNPATGMAFNSDLAGKAVADAKKNPTTVLLFEVPQTGRNLALPFKPQAGQSPSKIMGQPRDWITEPVNGSINVNGGEKSPETQGMNGL